MKKSEPERLNILASAAMEAFGWLPLSVRYRAAAAASREVDAWLAVEADDAREAAAFADGEVVAGASHKPPPFSPQYDLIGDAEQPQGPES